MLIRIRYFFLIPVLLTTVLITGEDLLAQKLLPDTVYVRLHGDSLIVPDDLGLNSVHDNRPEDPHFLGFTQRKAWLFLRIDREIHSRDSLTVAISRFIPDTSLSGRNYQLDVDRFEIREGEGRFSSSLELQADIAVYEQNSDSLWKVGTLYYDYPYYPHSRREAYSESVSSLFHAWHTDFKLDLMTVQTVNAGMGTELTPNFIINPDVRSLYLNARTTFLGGLNWFGFQGELYFSRPETKMYDSYFTGLIRYINRPAYESFAIGRRAAHRYRRLNDFWRLDVDGNLLLGFCRWKPNMEIDPTLYQLFDIEVSSVQSLEYYPMNRNGFTFSAGFIENASYVPGLRPSLELGLIAGVGYKF